MFFQSARRLFILLAIVSVVPLSQAGSDQWVEVRSKNFTVITDAGPKQGQQVLLRFEEMRAAFSALFQRMKLNDPVPLEIVAFRNGKELRQVCPIWKGKPVELAGLFQPGEDRNFIALDLSAENGWGVVFHEYAHLLLNTNLPPRPLWLDEGYADYFSTLKFSGNEIQYGTNPVGHVETLNSNKWMKSSALFSVEHTSREYNDRDRRSIFYAQSWLTVHYFFSKKQLPQLSTFLKLMETKHMSIPDAFQQAFGITTDQFDRILADYFRGKGVYFVAPAPKDVDRGPYQSRALSPTEKDATIADLKYHSPDHRAEGVAEFKKVLEQDPNNEVANRGVAYAYIREGDFEKAGGYLKRASENGSRDARVYFFNAMVLSKSTGGGVLNIDPVETDAVRAQLLKAVELDPNYADAYNMLAVTESVKGRPKEAVQNEKRALELNPRNEYYQLNLATFYLRAEEWDNASALLNTLQGSSNIMVAKSAEQTLAQIENLKTWKAQGLKPRAEVSEPENDADQVEVVEQPKNVSGGGPSRFLKGTLVAVD